MKIYLILFLHVVLHQISWGQDGRIVDKQPYTIPDSIFQQMKLSNPIRYQEAQKELENVRFYKITYMSDGLKVIGYIAEPIKDGKYPCIIFNRGGNRAFGQLNGLHIANILGRIANWGYVVVASQYRGNAGGEGKEEFGGKDIQDVLNLIPVLEQLPKADTSRIGIEGESRGGMMTYLALKHSTRFKAAVVISGLANAFINISKRPPMEQNVFSQLVPNYWENKDEELKKRSAVFWADQICKTTPLLILHGSSDWRVPPEEALELVKKLYEFKHPTRFILYEGAEHGILPFRNEAFAEIKRHFDFYLRDGKQHPSMEPHGN